MRIVAHMNGRGEKEFELIELTEKDVHEIQKELRTKNLRIMAQTLKDADALLRGGPKEPSPLSIACIAGALFEKLATKQFSEEQKVLTKKVHYMKEEQKALSHARHM